MGHSKAKFVKTYLQCPNCGRIETICRLLGRQKKSGHKKKLYCFTCEKRTNHVEHNEEIFYPEWIRERDRLDQEEAEKNIWWGAEKWE